MIRIPATETSYMLVDVGSGTHVFEIATVDTDAQEGKRSPPVSQIFPKADISVLTITITVSCSNCVYDIGSDVSQ